MKADWPRWLVLVAVLLAASGVRADDAKPKDAAAEARLRVGSYIDDGGHAMNVIEETIDATLDSNGQLQLAQQPRLPPGPVQVTIRSVLAVRQHRGLSDVVREIAAEQRVRGFPGRSAGELRAEEEGRLAEDVQRDQELEAARDVTYERPSARL